MRQRDKGFTEAITAAVLLRDGFLLESLGAFADVVAASRDFSRELHSPVDTRDEPIFDVVNMTLISETHPAVSSSGITIQAAGGVDGRRVHDLVMIPNIDLPGGAARKPVCSQAGLEWLRFQYEHGAMIVASGAAVFILAEARMTRGMRVVVPWWLTNIFSERFPGTMVEQSSPTTEDRRILTAEPGLDHLLTVKVIRRLVSSNMSRWLVRRRSMHDSLIASEIEDERDTLVSHAQAWMEQNYARPVKILELARHLNVSARALERRFKAVHGKSPLAQLQTIRIDAACRIFSRKAFSIGRVSNLVGYNDLRFFRQLFERETGKSPEAFIANLRGVATRNEN